MIDMSTPPPIAAFPSQWMKHRALLRKGTSKNIKVFILFRFTEFEKMSPFYKNISVFVYRLWQSDESIEIWVRVKMWSCCALNLCSSLRRNSMGWFFEYIFGITITVLKLSQNNDNRGLHLELYFHTGIGKVVPKSYRPKGQPRSTRNEFPIRADFGNSRKHPIWRLKCGENWQPKEPFYRQRSVIYGIVDEVCVYCEFWSVLGPV